MLKIAVVDDEKVYIDQIQEYIRQYSAEKKREIQTETFCDGSALLENYSPRFDIILLDIEMGKLNGMETAREIRKRIRTWCLSLLPIWPSMRLTVTMWERWITC